MANAKKAPPVRVVGEDESAPPQSYSDAAANGSRLDELRAMRRVLGEVIDSEKTLARDLVVAMRQAREISNEIREIEGEGDESGVSVNDDEHSADDAPFRLEAI